MLDIVRTVCCRTVKPRLIDPSEIRALDFKRQFGQSAMSSVSMSIGIDWPIADNRSHKPPSARRPKVPSA
jgi:hypothetical protein